MRKRTVKLWRLHDDGRKLYAGTIEAADPRELVFKWSAFLATAERGVYFATYRGSFIAPSHHMRAPATTLPPRIHRALDVVGSRTGMLHLRDLGQRVRAARTGRR